VATTSPSGFPVTIRQPGSTSKLRLYFNPEARVTI
jgi:hypothetical protein